MPLFTNVTGFPPGVVGPAGNSCLLAVHTLEMSGPTSIGTHYGIANVQASWVSTGRFHLSGPKAPAQGVRMWAAVRKASVSTGSFLASAYNVQPTSGTYEVHVTESQATLGGFRPGNAPSGSFIDTFWFITPVTTF